MFLFATAAAKTSGAWYAFLASDGLGQFIVIFLLLASVITWSSHLSCTCNIETQY